MSRQRFEDEIDKYLLPASRLLKARKRRKVVLVVLCLMFVAGSFLGLQQGLFFSSPPAIARFRNSHPDFVGRDAYLKALEKALLSKRWSWNCEFPLSVQVLWGIGGVGKTELAIKYANEHLHDYSLIWHFDCASEVLLEEGYRTLAEKLGISVDPKVPLSVVKRKVHAKLEEMRSHKPWLLIFDNVENELSDDDFPFHGGAILVTARHSDVRRNAPEHLQVSSFSKAEAVALLKSITQEDSSEEMEMLAEVFQCFPLALNQVAHYIWETPSIDVARYLKFSKEKESSLTVPVSEDHRYRYTLQNVWDFTLEELKKEAPGAIKWLEISSCFAPDYIPLSWFEKAPAFQGQVDEIIRRLQSLALISYDAEDRTFYLHRLMRNVIQNRKKDPEGCCLEALHWLVANAKFDRTNHKCWDKWRKWFLHANAILSHPAYKQIYSPKEQRQLYYKMAEWLYVLGKYSKGVEFFDRALELPAPLGFENPLFFQIYHLKGKALLQLTRLEEGEQCLQIALEASQALLGKFHPQVVAIQIDLNKVIRWRGKFDEAYRLGQETLKTFSSGLVYRKDLLVRALYGQGWNLCRLGENGKGERSCHRALEICKQIKDQPISLGWCYDALSKIMAYNGDLGHAEEFLREAFDSFEEILPENHPFLGVLHRHRGEVYRLGGKYSAAIESETKARQFQNESGENSRFSGFCNSNTASSLQKLGNMEDAFAHHEKALKIFQNLVGDNSLDFARALRRFGSWHKEMGRYQEAIEIEKRVILCLEELFPDGHPVIAVGLKDMGECLLKLRRYREALECCEKGLQYWEHAERREHPQKAKVLMVMAEIYKATHQHQKAQVTFFEAFLTAHRTFHEGHPDLRKYSERIVDAFLDAEDLSWKKEVQQQVRPVLKKTLGRWHPLTLKMAKNI